MGLNVRTWNALCLSAYLSFPAILGVWFVSDDSLLIWPLLLIVVWGIFVAILGAIQGVLFSLGKLYYGCPHCNQKSHVQGGIHGEVHLDCPKCGIVRYRLGRISGLKKGESYPDEEEDDEPDKTPYGILSIPKRHPIAFCIVFAPVVGSIIAASVIHRFSIFYIIIPGFWCYVVSSLVLHSIFSGKITVNHRTLSRKRTPIRFWGSILPWALFYLFAAVFPIGYARQESNKERESLVHADEVSPILSNTELEQLGFKSKAVRSVSQSDWDRQQFGPADLVEQEIRSLNPMKDDRSMFPRFTIIRESYGNEELAQQRWRRLRDHDPELDSKLHSGLVLRDGFVRGKDVWIVTTDAVIFSHQELDKIMRNIQNVVF